MQYCGWPNYVNRRIIDSTGITVGEGATQSDAIEGSPRTKIRMLCANPPDKYSVKMHFNCYEKMTKDSDGNTLPDGHVLKYTTEKDRFFMWLKGTHKFGAVPFSFPSILWNSNNKTSFSEEEIARGNSPDYEYYVITSAAEGSKHGDDIEISMTWETYATGVYEIPYEAKPTIAQISGHDGYAVVSLATTPMTNLESSAFTVKIDNTVVGSEVYTNEVASNQLYIIYPKITDDNSHTLTITPDSTKATYSSSPYTATIKKGD